MGKQTHLLLIARGDQAKQYLLAMLLQKGYDWLGNYSQFIVVLVPNYPTIEYVCCVCIQIISNFHNLVKFL